MSAKKVSISFDETTINLLDAELRRRNDRAERTGQPTVSRSALVRSYIHDALNRERIEELKRLEREANPVIVADMRGSLTGVNLDEVVSGVSRSVGSRFRAERSGVESGLKAQAQRVQRLAMQHLADQCGVSEEELGRERLEIVMMSPDHYRVTAYRVGAAIRSDRAEVMVRDVVSPAITEIVKVSHVKKSSGDVVITVDLRQDHAAQGGLKSDLRGMAAREQVIERVAGMVPLDATGNLEQ